MGAIIARVGVLACAPLWGQMFSVEPSVIDTHPTVAEFREEMTRADIVVRARIIKTIGRRDDSLGETVVILQPRRVYKGSFDSEFPCVRIELHQSKQYKGAPRLPDVNEEVLLPLDIVHPRVGPPPPAFESVHYLARFFYTIAEDGRVQSIFGLPPEMRAHATIEGVEALIRDACEATGPETLVYEPADVLFSDDFDDGSLAGWVLLEGGRDFHKPPISEPRDVTWVGPESILHNQRVNGEEDPPTRMTCDPATGVLRGVRDGKPIEIGVFDGRLRLRGGHYWEHLAAVTGDPEWTDYQIDVDVYNFDDPAFEGRADIGQVNYLKFGPYGRVHVPNLPLTRGEHSFVAVEFGNFANYDVSELLFGNSAFQIRCKYPETPPAWRDHSVLLRTTRILDYDAWPIPRGEKIHLTAKYFGGRVEGWIDGERVLAAQIPDDHPGARRGRIALWSFETWAEFDNVKVTRLVPYVP